MGGVVGKSFSYLLIGAIVVLAGIFLWRQHTRVVATQFMPKASVRHVVPAATQVPAVMKHLVTSTTQPGDAMLAFVTDPVMINGSIAIPSGTRLDGVVEKITKTESKAVTWVRFNSLVIDDKPLRIQTDRVLTSTTIATDFEILGDAANTLTEAGVGAAMGAASRNPASINAGVAVGALRGAASVQSGDAAIMVVLSQPVEVIR
jgi:hypothetical protein